MKRLAKIAATIGITSIATAVTLVEFVVVLGMAAIITAAGIKLAILAWRGIDRAIEDHQKAIIEQIKQDTNNVNTNASLQVMFLGAYCAESSNVRLLWSPTANGTNWQPLVSAVVDGLSTNMVTANQSAFFRLEVDGRIVTASPFVQSSQPATLSATIPSGKPVKLAPKLSKPAR